MTETLTTKVDVKKPANLKDLGLMPNSVILFQRGNQAELAYFDGIDEDGDARILIPEKYNWNPMFVETLRINWGDLTFSQDGIVRSSKEQIPETIEYNRLSCREYWEAYAKLSDTGLTRIN